MTISCVDEVFVTISVLDGGGRAFGCVLIGFVIQTLLRFVSQGRCIEPFVFPAFLRESVLLVTAAPSELNGNRSELRSIIS